MLKGFQGLDREAYIGVGQAPQCVDALGFRVLKFCSKNILEHVPKLLSITRRAQVPKNQILAQNLYYNH